MISFRPHFPSQLCSSLINTPFLFSSSLLLQQHVESHILQNILSTILKVDKNNDRILDHDDISALLVNLSTLHSVEVNEDLFRKKIRKSDRSIHAVLEIVKNLLGEDDPAGERMFVFSSSNI